MSEDNITPIKRGPGRPPKAVEDALRQHYPVTTAPESVEPVTLVSFASEVNNPCMATGTTKYFRVGVGQSEAKAIDWYVDRAAFRIEGHSGKVSWAPQARAEWWR